LVPPSDEIHPDEGVLARILELAGTEMILVGGQARATFRRQRDLTLLTGQIEKELPDKQDEHGIAQLHLAIATVREFLSDIAAVPLLHIKSFATKKLPQLLRLMSAARRGELETVVK
jgi:hypothetical protein